MGLQERERIAAQYGLDWMNASILQNHGISGGNDFDVLEMFLSTYLHGGTAVEIGTCCGVGAAVLAQFADRVITFDPKPQSKRAVDLWEYLEISDRIEQRIVHGDVADVSGIDFQFALVDGNHSEEHVRWDFDAVKHCGMVMFHDYGDKRQPGVKRAVDSITDTGEKLIMPPYALWLSI